MFGIKPKLMKCRFELIYFYDLMTYFKTIRAKVVMFGIRPKLMKCRFELTYTKTLFRLSPSSNTTWEYTAVLNKEYTCNVTIAIFTGLAWHRWAHGPWTIWLFIFFLYRWIPLKHWHFSERFSEYPLALKVLKIVITNSIQDSLVGLLLVLPLNVYHAGVRLFSDL
jgi:ammonia channel protein AmtB